MAAGPDFGSRHSGSSAAASKLHSFQAGTAAQSPMRKAICAAVVIPLTCCFVASLLSDSSSFEQQSMKLSERQEIIEQEFQNALKIPSSGTIAGQAEKRARELRKLSLNQARSLMSRWGFVIRQPYTHHDSTRESPQGSVAPLSTRPKEFGKINLLSQVGHQLDSTIDSLTRVERQKSNRLVPLLKRARSLIEQERRIVNDDIRKLEFRKVDLESRKGAKSMKSGSSLVALVLPSAEEDPIANAEASPGPANPGPLPTMQAPYQSVRDESLRSLHPLAPTAPREVSGSGPVARMMTWTAQPARGSTGLSDAGGRGSGGDRARPELSIVGGMRYLRQVFGLP